MITLRNLWDLLTWKRMFRGGTHSLLLSLIGLILIPSTSWAIREVDLVFERPSASPPDRVLKGFTPFGEFEDQDVIKKKVNFWVRIYTQHTTQEGLVHDSKDLDIVYEVLDLNGMSRRAKRRLIRKTKQKWKRILKAVHRKRKNPEKLNAEEKRVFDFFKDNPSQSRFLEATRRKRMRFQLGQSNRFKNAIKISGRYLPLMESVFRKEGLPLELTRLPFVESSFNYKARSKVGASGIWQFIRSTGRRFLKINSVVDERNDPIRATSAAASLLKRNFESLRSWPLAVIAYNHGRKGMMRAVRRVGSTDLSRIITRYKGPRFGFASRNFYPSLLAAIEVEKNSKFYFGEISRDTPIDYVDVGVVDYVSAIELTKRIGLNMDTFKKYNPGFTSSVYRGRRLIPAGYRIRLPASWGKESGGPKKAFWTAYNQIPDEFKHRSQRGSKRGKARRISSKYGK